MDFEQLLKMDIITWLQPEFDRGGLFVDRDSKKISMFRTYDTSTPWEHILQDQDLECRNFQLLFTHLKVLPTRCRECWKVVVKPRTLQELFEIRKVLEVVAKEHVIGCKLGIEERDWVPSYYGAYFYNRGRERGEECFELVSDLVGKAVSIDIPVYLKNSCTEMEMASKGWQHYKRNPDDDARERWFFENIEEVDHREQPVFLKLRVWRRWIAWAWKWDRDSRPWIEDMFNDGNPLYWQPKPVMWNDATLIRKEV